MSGFNIYKGTGGAIGPVRPMDEADAYFWANRHRVEADRLARVKARTETNDQRA